MSVNIYSKMGFIADGTLRSYSVKEYGVTIMYKSNNDLGTNLNGYFVLIK